MNRLQLGLKRTKDLESERLYLQMELTIDGKPLVDFVYYGLAVSLYELEASLKQDGEYFIITCSCGDPRDAGIRTGIEVRYSAKDVIWIYRDPLPDPVEQSDLLKRTKSKRPEWRVRGVHLPTRTYVFPADEYKQAIVKGIKQVIQELGRPENAALDTSPINLRSILNRG